MNHFSLRHKTHSLTSSFSRFSILVLRSRNCNFAAEHDTSENGQKNVLDQVSKYIYSSSSTTMLVIRVPCCVALTNLARHQRDRQISPGGIQKKVLHHYTQVLHSSGIERDTQVCSHKLPNWWHAEKVHLLTTYYIAETTFGSDRSCCLSYIFFLYKPHYQKIKNKCHHIPYNYICADLYRELGKTHDSI